MLPVVSEYDLYPYQQRGIETIRALNGVAGVFAEMGTGKTRVTLAYLAESQARRIVVVCPLSTAGVWVREVEKMRLPYRVTNLVSIDGTKERAAEVRQTPDGILLVNYDSFWRKPLRNRLLAWKADAVVLDEAHRIRHRGTRRSRFAHILGAEARIRLALSGTPITNGLEDAWSLYQFLDPEVFGRWPEFAGRYLILGGYGGFQVKGYLHTDEAHDIIARTSWQCTKDEALDLPERVDVEVPVTLSSAAREVYERVKKDSLAYITDVDGEDRVVMATIVLTQILRLQQITSGFVTDDVKVEHDLATDKLDVTRDLVEDAVTGGQRVVIFCRFRHDIVSVVDALKSHYRVARLDGTTDGRTRDRLLSDFARERYDVIVVQIRVGAVGIDLTAASVGIFFSTGYSLDDFLQARDRLHRHGQTRKVTYYHLIASQTVDEAVYKALSAKASLARQVTDLSYAMSLFS